MSTSIDLTAVVHSSTSFKGRASVGFCSRVEGGELEEESVRIGEGVRIGAFCIIEPGAELGDGVDIDHYCRIGRGAKIGARTRILYRAQIYEDALVGEDCIIAGDLVDRTIVGDRVTFHGNTAHNYADATRDWDETEEPSPRIHNGSVVAVGAIVIGGVSIGPRAYVAAGERVTCDVPREMVLRNGDLRELSYFRGIIKVREA